MSPMPPALPTPTGPSIWLRPSAASQEASPLRPPRLSHQQCAAHNATLVHGLLGVFKSLIEMSEACMWSSTISADRMYIEKPEASWDGDADVCNPLRCAQSEATLCFQPTANESRACSKHTQSASVGPHMCAGALDWRTAFAHSQTMFRSRVAASCKQRDKRMGMQLQA